MIFVSLCLFDFFVLAFQIPAQSRDIMAEDKATATTTKGLETKTTTSSRKRRRTSTLSSTSKRPKRPSAGHGGDNNSVVTVPAPKLTGPYEIVDGLKIYTSFELSGEKFEVGDNVTLHGGGVQEWHCKITKIYSEMDGGDGEPMFEGRWYWTPYDVNIHSKVEELVRIHAESDHELLLSDQTDANSCATIECKVRIVNRERYDAYLAKHGKVKKGELYFCCQHYYAMMHIVRFLNSWEYCFDPLSDEDNEVVLGDKQKEVKKIEPDATISKKNDKDQINKKRNESQAASESAKEAGETPMPSAAKSSEITAQPGPKTIVPKMVGALPPGDTPMVGAQPTSKPETVEQQKTGGWLMF